MKQAFFLFFLTFCYLSSGQSEEAYPGLLTDSIPVQGKPDETFAAYLPSGSDQDQKFPIVFIFDPAGRGKVGVSAFVEVAEKYKYLLICSNSSRNGPYGPNLEIADRLFRTVFASFTIDDTRIYTAGFSGGSRLAATIAVLSGAIQGVVACGAGFAQHPLYFPTKSTRFSYAGIVGNRDMNYREMQRTRKWLESLDISHELIVFEGEHQWPPAEAMERAFDWLHEELYRKGILEIDQNLREDNFNTAWARARDFESREKLVAATKEIERMIRYYPDLVSVDSLEKQLKKMRRDRLYRKENALLEKIASLEDTLDLKMKERFGLEVSSGESPDHFRWWQKTLEMINQRYSESDEMGYRMMAYRLKRQMFATVVESMDAFLREKKAKELEYSEQLLMLLDPDNPYTHYQLARKYASWNQTEKALQHLEKVLKLGWTDKEFLQKTREFKVLENLDKYKSLLHNY